MSRYINPFTDFGFKKLFGEEDSKVYLIDFLNSLLEDYITPITDIQLLKTEMLGQQDTDRGAVFDLYCKTANGERIIIELQKVMQKNFKDRSLFYSSFAIQEQNKKGRIEGSSWDFKLDAVYCIGLLNFNFEESSEYLHIGRVLNVKTNKLLLDKINFVFFEAQKFQKNIEECQTKQDKWLYSFCNLEFLEEIPENLQNDDILIKMFDKAQINALKTEEKFKYESSLKHFRDIINIEMQNLEKGIMKGKIQTQQEIAKAMKAEGLTIELIKKLTGLSHEQIANLED